MKVIVILAVSIVLWCMVSCPAVRDTPPTQSSSERQQQQLPAAQTVISSSNVSNDVREIIRPRCGSCHTSTLSTAKPGAVKIFDIAHEQWASTMTVAQLDKFKTRLNSLPENERSKIAEFVQQEKAKRGT